MGAEVSSQLVFTKGKVTSFPTHVFILDTSLLGGQPPFSDTWSLSGTNSRALTSYWWNSRCFLEEFVVP